MPDDSPPPESHDVTILLRAVRDGEAQAIDALFDRVYGELREIAANQFKRQPANHTLQPTALIHEAYLRLVDASTVDTRDRSHFFALAARVMRQLLVDHCRRKNAAKRGGDAQRITLSGAATEDSTDLGVLDLDEALKKLADLDTRKSEIVELRFFGGLSPKEVASALDVSLRTVESDWAFARAWLKKELGESGLPS